MAGTKVNLGPEAENIDAELVGNILTLKIDTTKPGHPSKSGKSMVIATTGGNQSVNGMKLGLNFYKGV
jgi:hypothetical protein